MTNNKDANSEPIEMDPDRAQPSGEQDAPHPDPGPATKHGDPLTDIDEEIAGGGGGND